MKTHHSRGWTNCILLLLVGAVVTFSLAYTHQPAAAVVEQPPAGAAYEGGKTDAGGSSGGPQRRVDGRGIIAGLDGRAYSLKETGGTILTTPLKTSQPVFKAFGLSPNGQRLLYTPLRRGVPSGELYSEGVRDRQLKKIAPHLVMEAAWSPHRAEQVAYTFSNGESFGLAVADAETGEADILVAGGVLADLFQWSEAGDGIYYYEVLDAEDGVLLTAKFIALESKQPQRASGRESPAGHPTLLNETSSDLMKTAPPAGWGQAAAQPFRVMSEDGAHEITGTDLLGDGVIYSRKAFLGDPVAVSKGQFLRLLRHGLLLRVFTEQGTQIQYVSFDGRVTAVGAPAAEAFNLPLKTFVLTQGGQSYGAPGNCQISSHTGSLSFAYDMQNATTGAHVLASAPGQVVATVSSVNCNSCDTSSCADFSSTCSSNNGWGNTVIIQHSDGTFTRYAHLQPNSVQVQTGGSACAGLYVGRQGHTGCTAGNMNGCGDHLHFQRQSTSTGASISISFSGVNSNPLSCGTSYTSASNEVTSCCAGGGNSVNFRVNGGSPVHPNGTLIQLSGGDGTIYVIQNGQKRGIPTMDRLRGLYANGGFDLKDVITVAADEFNSYPTGAVVGGALPSNNRSHPEGRLISNAAGEVSIVTNNGQRRPFASGDVFLQMGYLFCNVVPAGDYASYPAGPVVEGREPLPTITSSIVLSPSGSSYSAGQVINASFGITNRGNAPITFSGLTAGGRLNGSTIADFPEQSSVTLFAGQGHTYSMSRSFQTAGSYRFFPAFRTPDGVWKIALLGEIGVAPGVFATVDATVSAAASPTVTTGAAGSVTSSSAQLNGTVNPNGSSTNVWFEWDTNSSLANFSSTPTQAAGSGSAEQSVSAGLTGLSSGTTYFYRLAGSNGGGTSRGSVLSFTTPAGNINVTVQTSPVGRSFTVDGTTYTTTQTFTWSPGSSHTVGTSQTQSGGAGTQYVWSGWSDGGAVSHSVSPTGSTTYTASFATQHFLTMSTGSGGSAGPQSGWFNSGQSVTISATPSGGFAFSGWSGTGAGSYTGPNNPAIVTMNGPVAETANFTPVTTPTPPPTPPPTDVVWVGDAVPAGAVAGGEGEGWNWVGANPSPFSGSAAHQSNVAAGAHQHYFFNATQTLTVGTGDTLVAYVYLDPVSPPSEIMLQWNDGGGWEHRAYWGANNIAWGVDGTVSRRHIGPLPAAGQWTRLEVPASQVGLAGRTLSGMAFTLFGGRATWDHTGKSPGPSDETVWVEDAVPAGSNAGGDSESWNWISTGPTPFSGAAAHQSAVAPAMHQHYFHGAAQTLAVSTGDTLFTYVYLDPASPPGEVMLQWNDGTWEHRAYWGANLINFGADGTISRRHMGPLPAAGQWARLEVPASAVGLEGQTLTGMAFTLHGGRATWDRAGKVRGGDTVWVEDVLPTGGTSGGVGEGWNWVGANPSPFSGSAAHQSNVAAGVHQHYFLNVTQTLTVGVGDKLVAYIYLDPVSPPSEIMLQWNDGSWEHRAYWGANLIDWGADGSVSRRHMGPLPAAGQWVRLEVPASLVGLEGRTLSGMAFTLYNGRATWDRAGKSP